MPYDRHTQASELEAQRQSIQSLHQRGASAVRFGQQRLTLYSERMAVRS